MSGSTSEFLKVQSQRDAARADASSGFDVSRSVFGTFQRVRVDDLRDAWFSSERTRELLPHIWPWTVFPKRQVLPAALSSPRTLRYLQYASPSGWSVWEWRFPLTDSAVRLVKSDALVEQFKLRKELVGRVRDIDLDAAEFLAVLNERNSSDEDEVIGRFPLALLSDAERARLEIGMPFSLVTGFRRLVTTSGETLKTSLDTRVIFRRPPPASPAVLARAHEEALLLRQDP
jgi:hypothetical protein